MCLSTLGLFITDIIDVGTSKQVGWINAVVDITRMQYVIGEWIKASSKVISYAVRSVKKWCEPSITITLSCETANPQPTSISFINVRPKASDSLIGKRCNMQWLGVHLA